jgi:mannose-6-phosphate isomerase-like protein (cupin superfamily)
MIRLYFIWTCLLFYCVPSALAIKTTSNRATNASSFIFPYFEPDPYPVFVQVPAGELNNFAKIGASTENSFALVYATIPPGAGPPPHIHHWTDEWFYFPEGGIVIFSSDQPYPDPAQIPNGIQLPRANMHRYHAQPGDLIYGPRYYVHGFRNEGNLTRSLILIWTPDVLSEYFFQVGQIVTDPFKLPPIGNINKDLFVSAAPNFGMNMSSYWDEYVAFWDDDLQPALGMDAHGEELLSLLTNTTAQYVPC